MSQVPTALSYTIAHEWVQFEAARIARVGITDYDQGELGDIVFVELPAVGVSVTAGGAVGTIEAVKAVAELFAPVGGTVVSVNDALQGDPGLVNRDPYGGGWFFTVRLPESYSRTELLSAEEYLARLGAR